MTHETQPEHMDGSVLNTIEPAQTAENKVDSNNESVAGAESTEESTEAVDEITQLREQLAEAQAKAAEYLDKFQRSAAEFQNIRRRQEKQLSEESERANAGLIKRLLPILDDFDLAFQNVPAELQSNGEGETAAPSNQAQAWVEGMRQIQKKLLDTLAEEGVTRISNEGPFDPVLHEAISSEPNEEVESGHIIEAMRAGYEYKGRVLRPALVRVAL